MPFDLRDFSGALPDKRGSDRASRRAVAWWLLAVCAMLWVMIVLGGATRLTGAGLSIMEWQPITGILPPLSAAEWRQYFEEYQKIPQYQILNSHLSLQGYKHIFWLEWTHRFWGRMIGFAFLLPLGWFWWTGRISPGLRNRLAVIFLLGALQGAVGWFMVASGFFPDRTAVAPVRLVVHLALALLLYGAIFWTALSLLDPWPRAPVSVLTGWLARALLVVLGLTICAGGLVAGNHAGLAYNTFPAMDGGLIPDAYGALSPWWRDITENIAAVQFHHRLLATLTALLATGAIVAGARLRRLRPVLAALGFAVTLQYALGVATLLLIVPVPLAVAHQAVAVAAVTACIALIHATRALRPVAG
jgi:cytochrome c oxidase assembly protein subunit 15